jgi:WhiB family redox-sensing transcriptional regulator
VSRQSFGFTSNHLSAERPRDWRDAAYCRDQDPELYYPIGTAGPARDQEERAKATCRRCPVTDDCLNFALENGIDTGVWGGLSENERRAVKRRGGLRVLRADAA